MAQKQQERFAELGMSRGIHDQGTANEVVYYSTEDVANGAPKNDVVVVLLHGYPQSALLWRHLIPPLKEKGYSIYVPDLPGYGESAPASSGEKGAIGRGALKPLGDLVKTETKIVIVGHDRGARVAHRLGVDNNLPNLKIVGIMVCDIFPTMQAWLGAHNDPKNAAKSFHWPLLANVEIAADLIDGYGRGKWCKLLLNRWRGPKYHENVIAKGKPTDDDVWMEFFEKESVVRATCEDYRAGALEDVDLQRRDQEEGRKLEVPTVAVYSTDYLGDEKKVHDSWIDWVAKPELLKTVGCSPGVGHFVPEEETEKVFEVVVDLVESLP
jgi:pimeloyl-ACP methyl ester carboxylesterase